MAITETEQKQALNEAVKRKIGKINDITSLIVGMEKDLQRLQNEKNEDNDNEIRKLEEKLLQLKYKILRV